jgi:methionyl-tRNA synthetase
MVRAIEQQWKKVGQNLEYVHVKDALKEAIQLARFGNQYFDQTAPWALLTRDRAACATALHVSLRVARSLAVLMGPFLPFSSSRLWHALGYDSDVHALRWDEALQEVPTGQKLRVGKPLFTKIELGVPAASPMDRLDVRVAQILEVKEHPNADKLYVLQLDLGDERRQIVAGIRNDYTRDQLRGRKIVVLANLEPAKLRGIESRGMLLAAEDRDTVGILIPPPDADVGSQVLGAKGAPILPFSEFQKYRLQVGSEGTVLFLGKEGEARVTLSVDGVPIRVDKGLPTGTWVH